MEMQASDVESVTLSDILGLATWNRQRSSEELQEFINSRHGALADSDELQ